MFPREGVSLIVDISLVQDYTNTYELSKKPKNLFHVLKPMFFSTIYSFCHILKKMKSIILFIVIFIPFNCDTKVLKRKI